MQRGTSNSGACLNARCEQNLGSPMSAIDIKYLYRFHLHSPKGTTGLAQSYWLKIANFPYPLLFSTLACGDRFRIYVKALQILRLEFSRQQTVKIWWF